jgi:CheY-like chemotaxis protein
VSSEPNSGSAFVFYVSTRLSHGTSNASTGNVVGHVQHRPGSMEDAMKAARLNVLIVEDNLVNQKVLSKQLQRAGCNVSVAGNGAEALTWLESSVYWRGTGKKFDAPNEARVTDEANVSSASSRRNSDGALVDILLMDIEMPVMDGLTCARRIREYEKQGLLGPPTPPSLPTLQRSASSSMSSAGELELVERWMTSNPAVRLPILAVSANARSEQVAQALAAGMDDAISKPFRIPELWPKMAALIPRCA